MTRSLDRGEAERAILAVLPAHAPHLARLRIVADAGRWPVVTVVGKYNHGKSRLLNELIGAAVFAVADKRETLVLAAREHAGVRWLDAPGLDADVDGSDDGQALRAAWLESDIRLFVHAVTEGELDAGERALLASLIEDGERTQRQTVVVLSRLDELQGDEPLAKVRQAIEAQVPALATHAVSATRHRQGVDRGSALMQARSGIPELQRAVSQALARVPQARAHEAASLSSRLLAELRQVNEERAASAARLGLLQARQRERFEQDLAAVLDKVAVDIRAVLDVPGPDHSLTPDSFANQFKVTPGKLERNRLQVGYSRACIAINAVLIRHGVTELPSTQRTAVRSLDNAIVAVLGVHVKYRKDLQRIFCEPAGRDRLRQDFARYFELSPDRVELSAALARAESGLHAAAAARAACDRLSMPSAVPA